jgi:hypothetical protein
MSKLAPIHSIRLGNWIYAFGDDFDPHGTPARVISMAHDDDAEETTLILYVPGFEARFGHEPYQIVKHGDYVLLAETEVSRETEAA